MSSLEDNKKIIEKTSTMIEKIRTAKQILRNKKRIDEILQSAKKRGDYLPTKDEQIEMMSETIKSALQVDGSYQKSYDRIVKTYPEEQLCSDGKGRYLTRAEVAEVFDKVYKEMNI